MRYSAALQRRSRRNEKGLQDLQIGSGKQKFGNLEVALKWFRNFHEGLDEYLTDEKWYQSAKIAQEDSKFGLSFADISAIISSEEIKELENIEVVGLMGMATFTDNKEQLQQEFSSLKMFYDQLKTQHSKLTTLSMGMSGDYQLAIEEGSTMVRIGSSIFGSRS